VLLPRARGPEYLIETGVFGVSFFVDGVRASVMVSAVGGGDWGGNGWMLVWCVLMAKNAESYSTNLGLGFSMLVGSSLVAIVFLPSASSSQHILSR
jgi:hypothetical protein